MSGDTWSLEREQDAEETIKITLPPTMPLKQGSMVLVTFVDEDGRCVTADVQNPELCDRDGNARTMREVVTAATAMRLAGEQLDLSFSIHSEILDRIRCKSWLRRTVARLFSGGEQ